MVTLGEPDSITVRAGSSPPARLLFLEEGGRVYVVPTKLSRRWATDALSEGAAEVSWPDGRHVPCATRLITDPDRAGAIRDRFREKYGDVTWRRHFSGAVRVIELIAGGSGSPPTEADRVRDEFDAVAANYLPGLETKPFERYLKEQSLARLRARLRQVDPLLEIGPGPGFESVPMLADGHRLLALDVSGRMLEQLRARARARGLAERLETRQGTLGDIEACLADLPDGCFGGAYSTFGAFNIEPSLERVPSTLARLIPPGGPVLIAVLNRPGIVPFLGELALRNPRGALARLGDIVKPEGMRYVLTIRLRTLAEWKRLFSPWFRMASWRPVSALTPPFDSPRLYRFFGPRGRERLRHLDRALEGLPGSSLLAEWLLLELIRTERPHPLTNARPPNRPDDGASG